MAIVSANDYDHIDIVNGQNTNRHMLKDAQARADVDELKSAITLPPTTLTEETVTGLNLQENGTKWVGTNGYNTKYVPCVNGKKLIFTITPTRTGAFRFGYSSAVPAHNVASTYIDKLSLTNTTPGMFVYTPSADGYFGFGYYADLLGGLTIIEESDSIIKKVTDLQDEIDNFTIETDKTLTVSDEAADAKVVGDKFTEENEYHYGEPKTETVTTVSGIDLSENATQYWLKNGYSTSYIPVKSWEKWTLTITAAANGNFRIGFSESAPDHQGYATYLATVSVSKNNSGTYTYMPSKDGYLSVSYYTTNLSSVTASGLNGGVNKIIRDTASQVAVLTPDVEKINTDDKFLRLQTTLEINRKLLNARQIPHNQNGTPLTLLHLSDIHADTAALARIAADAAKYGGSIDDMICTGDMVQTDGEAIDSWWNPAILTCIGNHDSAVFSGGNWDYDAISMALRDEYYIAPFESDWGITHTSGTSYYYKDYSTQKVRLIVMDCQLYISHATEAAAETAWLEGLLTSAITNSLHVIIAIHGPATAKPIVDCLFSQYGGTTTGTDVMSYIPDDVITAVTTAQTGGLKFIGYIGGHRHYDNVYKATETQMGVIVACAATTPDTLWYNLDLYRSSIADAYNLLTIDTKNTLVKIVRGGGANIDRYMRPRVALSYNYTTCDIISDI